MTEADDAQDFIEPDHKVLYVRVLPLLHRNVTRAAASRGMPMNTWVTLALEAYLKSKEGTYDPTIGSG